MSAWPEYVAGLGPGDPAMGALAGLAVGEDSRPGGSFASGLAGPLPWAGAFDAAAPAASSVSSTLPSLTLSPSFTLTSFTTPAAGDGTSIVALSDSSVTSESSAFTASPGATSTSM